MASTENIPSLQRSQTVDGSFNGTRKKNQDEYKPKLPRTRLFPTAQSTKFSFVNKLYRCPRTPPPEVKFDRENSFILDCKAVSNISIDNSTTNPKLGSAIPPYDAQLDRHTQSYFNFFGLSKTLEKTGQVYFDIMF